MEIETPDRPTVSIDMSNHTGRRGLSIRVNGMVVASVLLDVEELPPKSGAIERWCPYCGTEINWLGVDRHVCTADALLRGGDQRAKEA